jgi:hypothetical protein
MSFESHTSLQSSIVSTLLDVAIMLIIMLSLLFLLNMCEPNPLNRIIGSDTVVVEKQIILPPDTVYVDSIVARVKYKKYFVYDTVTKTFIEKDTVFSTKPFIAYMDTTVECNALKLEYHYPDNVFKKLSFITCPDTVIVMDTTVINSSSSLNDLKYAGYGFLGGFIVGTLLK